MLFCMMIRIIKKIPVFILFVAGLAIMAHTIVPHDHHPVVTIASQEDRCPLTNDKTHQHPNFPVHCHACNDLTSESAATLAVIRNVQSKYFVITCIFDLTCLQSDTFELRIFDFSTLLFKSDITDLPLLRAPPSLS